jgi:hypothetical protein
MRDRHVPTRLFNKDESSSEKMRSLLFCSFDAFSFLLDHFLMVALTDVLSKDAATSRLSESCRRRAAMNQCRYGAGGLSLA